LAEVEAALEQLLAVCRAEHPDIAVDTAAFVRHVASRIGAAELQRAPVADLYLAFACGAKDPAALDRFEQVFGPDIDRIVRRGSVNATEAADLGQQVRAKILVGGAERSPQILAYAGRGSLRGWVRVVASRMVVDQKRVALTEREVLVEPELLEALDAVPLDPNTQWLRAKYRDAVAAAMERAFAALPLKERRLLRAQLVERLGIDDLGALYGVHRTTAARWIEKARRGLVERIHAELRQTLGAQEATVRSLVGLVRSAIDLSVARLLSSEHDVT
jgi:RNA polymerase sigma-70 factor (ECF subfamily)